MPGVTSPEAVKEELLEVDQVFQLSSTTPDRYPVRARLER